MKEYAGLKVSNETQVLRCTGTQNDTVGDCPVKTHADKEFIVAVQNTQIR
jgi:hypothetical protein